ncbi:MAG TPA: helix-turn-helix transcriptional regulator [Rhizomicrobium sp.]
MVEESPIPNRIAEFRRARDWSYSDIGAACQPKATASEIQKLERGQTGLTVKWMRRIGHAFGVRPGELLSLEDSELLHEEREIIGKMRVLRATSGPAVLHAVNSVLTAMRSIQAGEVGFHELPEPSPAKRRLAALAAGMSEDQAAHAARLIEMAVGYSEAKS